MRDFILFLNWEDFRTDIIFKVVDCLNFFFILNFPRIAFECSLNLAIKYDLWRNFILWGSFHNGSNHVCPSYFDNTADSFRIKVFCFWVMDVIVFNVFMFFRNLIREWVSLFVWLSINYIFKDNHFCTNIWSDFVFNVNHSSDIILKRINKYYKSTANITIEFSTLLSATPVFLFINFGFLIYDIYFFY